MRNCLTRARRVRVASVPIVVRAAIVAHAAMATVDPAVTAAIAVRVAKVAIVVPAAKAVAIGVRAAKVAMTTAPRPSSRQPS